MLAFGQRISGLINFLHTVFVRQQVDILISKNQVLQILYLKHHVYKTQQNPQKFDSHENYKPYHTVLTLTQLIYLITG